MSKDQFIGIFLLVLCVLGIILYGWLVFLTEWALLVLQLTGFVAIAGVLGILSWIGYTLATTPPPKPIEDIEKELEEEMKKIEEDSEKPKESSETSSEDVSN